nr:alanyl aminopeptidase [Saprospiraceae bacterium]
MIQFNQRYLPFLTLFLFIVLIQACATSKKTYANNKDVAAEEIKKVNLKEIDIYPDDFENEGEEETSETKLTSTRKIHPFINYRSSPKIDFSLVHTKIDVSFDWTKQHVIGKITLTLKPHFYPQTQLTLDAKDFDIKSVMLMPQNQLLKYNYDGKSLVIDLDKEYKRSDKIDIFIEYIAKPNEAEEKGSAAITSDKGLFFINPLGEDKDKPMQIWTQGETENNSRWFPTIDKPNQFTTQELSITVEDKYMTLSNGIKVASKKNADGTRTDTWKQDKPHAPYLTMIAVGDFALVKDQWRNIPLEYIVEK